MNNDEQAIRSWLDDWLRASANGDSETMLAMLTDDIVSLPSHRNLKKTVGNLQKTCHTAGE
jgi:ketosteroid isomerase-like protein